MKPSDKLRPHRLTPIALALGLAFSGAAMGASQEWTGNNNRQWLDNANWYSSSVPAVGDVVTIAPTTDQSALPLIDSITGDVVVDSVTLATAGSNDITSLTLNGGSLTTTADLQLTGSDASSSEQVNLLIGSRVNVGGDLTAASGTQSAVGVVITGGGLHVAGSANFSGDGAMLSIRHIGTATVAGSLTINGANTSLEVVDGSSLTTGKLIVESGDVTLTAEDGSTLAFTSADGDALSMTGGNRAIEDATLDFTNGGGAALDGAALTIETDSAIRNAGTITLENASALTVETGDFGVGTVAGGTGGGVNTLTFNSAHASYGVNTAAHLDVTIADDATLGGALRHEGETAVEDGKTLTLTGDGDLSTSSGVDLSASGSLDLSGIAGPTATVNNLASTGASEVVMGHKNLAIQLTADTAYAGAITASGGQLTVESADGTTSRAYTLDGDLGYSGVINVGPAANLTLGASGDISDAEGLNLNGTAGHAATLTLGTNATVNNLSGNASSAVNTGNGYYTLTLENTRDIEFAGTLSGNGEVIQKGGHVLTLSGENTITGSLAIGDGGAPGHVVLTGTWGSGSDGSISVMAGSILDLGDSESDAVNGGVVVGAVDLANGATLNVRGVSSIGDLDADTPPAQVNFYLGSTDLKGQAAFLTVTDYTQGNLDPRTVVTINAASGVNLTNGFQLVDGGGDLADDLIALDRPITGRLGVTATAVYEVLDPALDVLPGFVRVSDVTLAPETKALAEGFLSGLALLNQGADAAHGEGIHRAVAAAAQADTSVAFGVVTGGDVSHESGSHVDVDGYNLLVGVARGFRLGAGKATGGLFFEYGNGDYTSSNSFNTGKVKGRGDTDYTGGGILARLDLASGAYVEGAARFGEVETDFRTAALGGARYDVKSRYYGLSVGGGYIAKLGETGELDVYGRYAYSQQKGDKDILPTGEPLKFDAVESQRLRLGARYTNAFSSTAKGYVGAALEHEFDGEANARLTVAGFEREIDAPELKGTSGIAEVGLTFTPSANNALSLDIGLQGYADKREGATGSVQLKYAF
ncbi:MAG: hypothetical protein LBF93_01435 [Zoogloeaceae bacterium]|jgi:hypothetical protein|nr:hypothetical protein [Zoogloeaceae bacterium]